jgi:glycosyltransferase involved in cell wall biosynthesis
MNFTFSKHVAQSIIEQYKCPPQKVVHVYAGCNTNIVPGKMKNDDYSNKNILFIGVDWYRKGGPDLIKAFQIVLTQHPDAILTIAGCSPKIDIPNCEVAGYVPIDQIHSYFRKASIFCMPTKIEPFGIVYIEAMAYLLPVVGTDVESISEFIENDKNGYLVKTGDIEGLANVLISLLNDPEKCRTFGIAGSILVDERFNWERVGKLIKENILRHITIESAT